MPTSKYNGIQMCIQGCQDFQVPVEADYYHASHICGCGTQPDVFRWKMAKGERREAAGEKGVSTESGGEV